MLKDSWERLRRKSERAPDPLMPGEAVDGDFEVMRQSKGGKRYDLARADQRMRELEEARKRLGLDDDDVAATLDNLEPTADQP